ncbi:hypothetical protein AAFP30_22315 [Gordonia sp. CPCC 205515]|uniref:hypothetical protein n=1 Tax=Gordonia sp. CPCC 205515 TaxID=3140791 RepID=UPI003AF35CAF
MSEATDMGLLLNSIQEFVVATGGSFSVWSGAYHEVTVHGLDRDRFPIFCANDDTAPIRIIDVGGEVVMKCRKPTLLEALRTASTYLTFPPPLGDQAVLQVVDDERGVLLDRMCMALLTGCSFHEVPPSEDHISQALARNGIRRRKEYQAMTGRADDDVDIIDVLGYYAKSEGVELVAVGLDGTRTVLASVDGDAG